MKSQPEGSPPGSFKASFSSCNLLVRMNCYQNEVSKAYFWDLHVIVMQTQRKAIQSETIWQGAAIQQIARGVSALQAVVPFRIQFPDGQQECVHPLHRAFPGGNVPTKNKICLDSLGSTNTNRQIRTKTTQTCSIRLACVPSRRCWMVLVYFTSYIWGGVGIVKQIIKNTKEIPIKGP